MASPNELRTMSKGEVVIAVGSPTGGMACVNGAKSSDSRSAKAVAIMCRSGGTTSDWDRGKEREQGKKGFLVVGIEERGDGK